MRIKRNPVLHAVGVFGVVAALVGGVTFAALSDTATMTDSQFTTATADLQIWNGSAYAETTTGFNYTNVVPGVETSVFTTWLKNFGGVALNVQSVSDGLYSTTGIANPALVTVKVVNVTDGNTTTNFALSDIADTTPDAWPGGALDPNEENQYDITVNVAPGAVTGSSASMTNLDLTFTGTQP